MTRWLPMFIVAKSETHAKHMHPAKEIVKPNMSLGVRPGIEEILWKK